MKYSLKGSDVCSGYLYTFNNRGKRIIKDKHIDEQLNFFIRFTFKCINYNEGSLQSRNVCLFGFTHQASFVIEVLLAEDHSLNVSRLSLIDKFEFVLDFSQIVFIVFRELPILNVIKQYPKGVTIHDDGFFILYLLKKRLSFEQRL